MRITKEQIANEPIPFGELQIGDLFTWDNEPTIFSCDVYRKIRCQMGDPNYGRIDYEQATGYSSIWYTMRLDAQHLVYRVTADIPIDPFYHNN